VKSLCFLFRFRVNFKIDFFPCIKIPPGFPFRIGLLLSFNSGFLCFQAYLFFKLAPRFLRLEAGIHFCLKFLFSPKAALFLAFKHCLSFFFEMSSQFVFEFPIFRCLTSVFL
jgi:hypothetical protein